MSRVSVLRVVSIATRAAWSATLLKEAPDREALAALVFVLSADGVRFLTGHGLPEGPRPWAERLIEAFGAVAGVEAVLVLAQRRTYARGPSWVDVLGELVEAGMVPPELHAPILAFARGEPAVTPALGAALGRLVKACEASLASRAKT
jgi:hypothetical protein